AQGVTKEGRFDVAAFWINREVNVRNVTRHALDRCFEVDEAGRRELLPGPLQAGLRPPFQCLLHFAVDAVEPDVRTTQVDFHLVAGRRVRAAAVAPENAAVVCAAEVVKVPTSWADIEDPTDVFEWIGENVVAQGRIVEGDEIAIGEARGALSPA